MLDPLGIKNFHPYGTFALELKILTGAMLLAAPFNILADMPSGLLDLDDLAVVKGPEPLLLCTTNLQSRR